MFEKIAKIFKNPKKNINIWYKKPKYRRTFREFITPFFPKVALKKFLVWMKFRDPNNDFIIDESINIDEIINHWNKQFIKWILNVIVTGFLVWCATLAFWYNPNYEIALIRIFSLGILSYIISEILKAFKSGGIAIANSFPRHGGK